VPDGEEAEEPMSERATASFDITTWDEEPYDERDGVRLSRARAGTCSLSTTS
jgi:hypothetical protein